MRPLPFEHVRDGWIKLGLHPVVELEFAPKSLWDVRHLHVLLQRRQYFFGCQDKELFHRSGVDPFLDPTPDGGEK